MPFPVVYFWRQVPFLRYLVPLIAGIVIQWHGQLPIAALWMLAGIAFIFTLSFFAVPFFKRYKLSWLNGAYASVLFISIGALLAWYHDIRNSNRWFAKHYSQNFSIVVSLDEPLVEKTRSFKADASVRYVLINNQVNPVKGKVILYFRKDSLLPELDYGSMIVLNKSLQEIRNSGNPGGFDYKRYALFQDITHQAYLKPDEFQILNKRQTNLFQRLFYPAREKVLSVLRKNIKGDKEAGLAEALLIGYKNDLDKTLVQSYTNTGVVHVIAISGLHIGLIYGLLALLLKPLRKTRYARWLTPLLIIAGLWAFSWLAGGQPSVLRSAVMFTCIALGQSFGRNTSIYNTLAFSAFILLCYNPYWLWDVGFQLSYAAVLSIVIFMKPVYNWFYIKNKILDFFWKLNAVTLAAQILTLPVSLYHFHQFPGSFWLTNFLAVPLSSLILVGEILLCIVSFVPPLALLFGKILAWLIWVMNSYIERIEELPFALWDGLQISFIQMILLFGFAAGMGYWLLEKVKRGVVAALVCLLVFAVLRSYSFIVASRQKKIIVYNVPQHRAIDFIDGRHYLFTGDSDLVADDFARNFHLKPSRVLHRIGPTEEINDLFKGSNYMVYKSKMILLVDRAIYFNKPEERKAIDLLIISKNPGLYIPILSHAFNIKQVVFDGSVPFWKLPYWKSDCDSLHIPYHDVNEKGAFVMHLDR
ncbi:MAG: ComEC family competence protein [Chitinophagaceae bacterium]|nr:ComEC family competence protein [Chitinophagaceae bacterium]